MISMEKEFISLAHGSGGKEMAELIKGLKISNRGNWQNFDNDSATLDIGNGQIIVFTTDSFIVDPIFFPGGDIGHIAACGTINDLAVMGAVPLGLSLSFVIEEGFLKQDLSRITESMNKISIKSNVPIVTGDTKVMERGKLDKIIINTAGIGIMNKDELLTKKIEPGDKIIISGGLGEHAVALLSKRFDFQTNIVTDSKPLIEELQAVKHLIKIAKDPTRGGIASILNELCQKHKVGMLLDEQAIPAKEEVRRVVEMLGINLYELACEGRFVCIAAEENAELIEKTIQNFNMDAKIIGEVTGGDKVVIQTILGKRILPLPSGRIVPRIC